jgi:hypothetical protein
VVAALAAFGAVAYLLSRRPEWLGGAFLAAVVLYFTFLPAFAQSPQDRYRLPIDALLFMFSFFGAGQLGRQLGLPRIFQPRPKASTADAADELRLR